MSKAFDVIVLNSHGVGQYAYCDYMPVWDETLSVKNWHVAEDGGKGSNVTVALGRLGLRVAYIGKVGNDPWGDLGDKWMRDAGADTTYLYRTDEVSMGTGLILIGPDGRNTVIDGDSSAEKLTVGEVTAALDDMADSAYFVTGFEVPQRISLAGARHAKSLGMVVALNPSPLPEEPMGWLDYVDYLFINEVEGHYNDPAVLDGWVPGSHVSTRGYMLGYYDMRSPGVKGIHRFLARLCDGPVGMHIVRIDLP